MTNHLLLSGMVSRIMLHITSPSGIPHFQFILDHSSVQEEAGFYRKAWCQIPVIASGKEKQNISQYIQTGSKILVKGFISCHKKKNGLSKLVLHAKHVTLIN